MRYLSLCNKILRGQFENFAKLSVNSYFEELQETDFRDGIIVLEVHRWMKCIEVEIILKNESNLKLKLYELGREVLKIILVIEMQINSELLFESQIIVV